MKLFKQNIQTMTVTTLQVLGKAVYETHLIFDIYTTEGDNVSFTAKMKDGSLVGIGKINGKRGAIKNLLLASDWYSSYIEACHKDVRLLDAIYVRHEEKLQRINKMYAEFISVPTSIRSFEQKLFKSIWEYKYDKFSETTIKCILEQTRGSIGTEVSEQDALYMNNVLDIVWNNTLSFSKAHPHFKGMISKRIVANYFYQISTLYKEKYKELIVEKKVTYSFQTFYSRLVGYLNFRTKEKFTNDEFREIIQDYIYREKKFIDAEDKSLAEQVKDFYKQYISALYINNTVYKSNALSVLKSYAAPSPL